MFKKIILSILASLLVFTSSLLPILTRPAYAQESTWYQQTYKDWATKVFDENTPDEIFGERYTYAQVEWVVYSLVWFLLNHIGAKDLNDCLMNSSDPFNDKAFDNCLGLISDLFSMFTSSADPGSPQKNWLAVFTDRPVSTVAYFKDIASRLKIIPEAKAQGFGFTAASPALILWRAVRNVTYFLLILVIIAMAFMIMFRVKISPQVVITVQSALPKVILALILITFSYAIAGFMIDLMYVVIGLLAGITTGNISTLNWSDMFYNLTDGNNAFSLIIMYFIWFLIVLIPTLLGSPGTTVFGALGVGALVASGVGDIIIIALLIVFAIILLVAAFKIVWLLIKTFVNVLLLIIFGPIQILLGTIGFGGIGGWLRSLAANLAVYPVVGFMFIMSFMFLRATIAVIPGGALFPFEIIPVISGAGSAWDPPLTVGTSADELLWLISSLVIFLLIPKAGDMIKALIEGKPFAYGTAIGAALFPAPIGWGLGALEPYARGRAEDYVGERKTYRGIELPTRWDILHGITRKFGR